MDRDALAALPGELAHALGETGIMVGIAAAATAAVGLPLGVLLFISDRGLLAGWRPLRLLVNTLINAVRATPFVILLVLVLPFTQIVAGTTIGPVAASIPLSLASIAFYARLAEASLREVDPGMIEAALSAGCTTGRLIRVVLIWEALPGLVRAGTITLISLISLSAMAGIVGGGGIGDLAIRFGYYRYETATMAATVVVLLVIVQLIQLGGDWLARRLER
jgi:D-methionine transport system permease protein